MLLRNSRGGSEEGWVSKLKEFGDSEVGCGVSTYQVGAY